MIKKTAIIIGASSDIGKAIAKKFASNGYSLALTYNKTDLEFDFDFKKYKLDITNSAEISSVFSQISNDFKYIDTLVVCSGVAQKRALIFDTTDEEIDNLIDTNLNGVIKCVKSFVKIVSNRNPANIVLLGSFVEKNGCSCESVYSACKGGLSTFARSLSSELGNLDIRINVVAPGFIDTKMNNNLSEDEKTEIANMTPLKRLGTAVDIANAVSFLSSDDASFITGQTLFVDGGLILD